MLVNFTCAMNGIEVGLNLRDRVSHGFCSSENHRHAYTRDFSLTHKFWALLFCFEELVEKVFTFFGLKVISCFVIIDPFSHALADEESKGKGAGLEETSFLEPQ